MSLNKADFYYTRRTPDYHPAAQLRDGPNFRHRRIAVQTMFATAEQRMPHASP
jgi:hypothetical protein